MEGMEEIGKYVEEYNKEINEILQKLNSIISEIVEATEKIGGYFSIEACGWKVARQDFKFGTGYVSNVVVRFNGRAIPSSADELGSSYYAYGDFNNHAEYIDIDDVEDAVENVLCFVEAVKKYLIENAEKIREMKVKIANVSLSS